MNYDPMYDAVYKTFGVDAVLTLSGTDGEVIPLRAIDITSSFNAGDGAGEGGFITPRLNGMRPGASIRNSSIPNIVDFSELDDATLLMNDNLWRVMSSLPKPSPNGEASGERYLFLIAMPQETA